MTQLKMTLSSRGLHEAIANYLLVEYGFDIELAAVTFSDKSTSVEGFEASLFLAKDADQLELPLEEEESPPFAMDDPAIPFK